MLIIAWDRLLEVVASLFPDKKFKTCVKLSRHLADDPEGAYLTDTWFLFNHKIRHVRPVCVDEAVGEGKAKKHLEKARNSIAPSQAFPDGVVGRTGVRGSALS